uniref:Uncharacterized protein n=1 Tax=Cacopsylla melanoneura TaxID=428564 RepID=A0A8D8WIM3_9HEMI
MVSAEEKAPVSAEKRDAKLADVAADDLKTEATRHYGGYNQCYGGYGAGDGGYNNLGDGGVGGYNSNSSSRDNSCCMKTRPTSLFRVEQRQCRILSPRLWNWGVSFSSSLIWCKNRRKWLRG